MTISLTEAIKKGRLDEFVGQEDRARVGGVDKEEFRELLETVVETESCAGQAGEVPKVSGLSEN